MSASTRTSASLPSPPAALTVATALLGTAAMGIAAIGGLAAWATGYSHLAILLMGLATMALVAAIALAATIQPSLLVHLCLIGGVLDQWERLDFIGVPFLTASKALVLLACGLLLVRSWYHPPGAWTPVHPTPVLAHLPFSAVCVVSALAFGYSLTHSLRWAIAPATLPVLAWVLSQYVGGRREAARLAKAFAIYSFLPIGVALAETVLRRRIGGSFEILIHGASDIFRVAGNFDNPNDFVVLLLFSIPLLLLWAFQTSSWGLRLFLLLGTILQGAILLKTYSRSGYLSLAVVFASMTILGRGRLRKLAIAVCILGALAMASLPDVRERLLSLVGFRPTTPGASQAMASLDYRRMLLAVGWKEFLEHPILGTGYGNIGFEMHKHSTLLYQTTVENTYMEILAEMGVVGFLFYLLFLGVAGRALLTGLRNSRGDPLTEGLFLALACGYCGFVFNGLFDSNLVDNIPWVLLPVFVHLGTRAEKT